MSYQLSRTPRRPFTAVLLALSALTALGGLGGGCAYYNILYNAKTKYATASKIPREKDGSVSRGQITSYDEVIEKCELMIKTYPNSRWVDDAMLLIALALYGQDDFDGAIDTIDELEEKQPESDLLEKARFLKGRSYADWGKDEEAVEMLNSFIEQYPNSDELDHVLYYTGRSSMKLGDEARAMEYLGRLGKEFPKSRYKTDADIEVAEILLDKGQFEKSLEVYQRLTSKRLAAAYRYRVWSRMALVYKELGRYQEALKLLAQIDQLVLDSKDPENRATALLLTGESYAGLDSLTRAIDTYKDVATSFKKSRFSAEAQYRIGMIYQVRLDSLEVAKTHFDEVPRQYAGSEYASDAIKRSANISTLIRLRESTDDESPEARALRQFSLAEVQLFQFNNTTKALEEYRKIIGEFPQSEFAPKAAYAVGYIYGIVLGDSVKAYESYKFLMENYPDSEQALGAYLFYAPAADSSAGQPGETDEDGAVDESGKEG